MNVRRHLPHALGASWTVIDQILSSVTNVIMSILVARNVSAEGFGFFSVAFLLFSLTIGVTRCLVEMPLSIRNAADVGEQRQRTAADALGTSVSLALPVSLVLFGVATMVGRDLGLTLAALAITMPALVTQDTARYAFFAWGRPDLATLSDFMWAVVQFLLSWVLIVTGHASAASLVLVWGLGALAALIVACFQLAAWPRLAAAVPWVRKHKDITGYILGQFAVTQGAAQGGVLLFGGIMGVANIGAVRAAQTLTGPLTIVSNAATTYGIPQVARHGRMPRRAMTLAGMASLTMFAVGVVYTTVLLLLPDNVGTAMFGDSWAGASSVLLAVAAGAVISGLKLGPYVFIAARGLVKRSFPLVVLQSVLLTAFMAFGAYTNGIVGLAWGMAAAQAVMAPAWFLQLRAAMRAGQSAAPQPAPTA